MAVALALDGCVARMEDALETDAPPLWERLADVIRARGHDPNWRRGPSVLEQLHGITAPPGRPRKARQRDCPESARPFRRCAGLPP